LRSKIRATGTYCVQR